MQNRNGRKIDIVAASASDAANQGYDLGFAEGYEAALLVVETMIADGEKTGHTYTAQGCQHALNMSRAKAKEMMGTPAFIEIGTVSAKPSTGALQ